MALMFQSLCGLVAFLGIAWALSENRRALPARRVAAIAGTGIAIQLLLAGVFTLIPQASIVFSALSGAVAALQAATAEGMKFLFGYLAGGPAPFDVTQPANGFVLALQALPIVLLISVISRMLYHWGILQKIVGALATALSRSMGVGGPVATASAANVFIGMVEAPVLIRPYMTSLSRGGLFAVMSVGMATVAGTVMALYAGFLEPKLPGAAGHVLLASLMSAPAALIIARLMVPWTEEDEAPGAASGETVRASRETSSLMDAIATGTVDGVRLMVSISAMLVVMVALVALANAILAGIASPLGWQVTVEQILGWLMSPLAWLMGIPWAEAAQAGQLMGLKTVLNEFIAYVQLAGLGDDAISDRSRLIMAYALCGFANFGSLGIMTGGLVALCPERRADILQLAPKTLISGTLATMMTGACIGLITPG